MDEFYFDFVEKDDHFDADSMANDSLPSKNFNFEQKFEEEYEEGYNNGIDQIPIPIIETGIEDGISINKAIAVMGAITGKETPLQAEIMEEVTKYISLTDARELNKFLKKPLKPFEQFVQDVMSGKKNVRDPLI